MTIETRFTAIVLAGDRRPDDPLLKAANSKCKALIPVAGKAMVRRVLEALGESRFVDQRILCGPPWAILKADPGLIKAIETGEFQWIENQQTPSLSACHAMQSIPTSNPILITTADHALLDADMLNYFCERARNSEYDVVVGLADYDNIIQTYPNTKRTALKFRNGSFSGCNMFAFTTPVGRSIAKFWVHIEKQRKNPFRVVSAAGWTAIIRYAFGWLTLEEGLQRISRRLDLRIGVIIMPQPEAAIDIDTVEDWKLADTIARVKDQEPA